MSGRSRNWCWTLNNYTPDEIARIERDAAPAAKYVVYQPEVGENGTKHLQGFVSFENPRALAGVKRLFGTERIHLEVMRGTIDQACAYCTKDDTRDPEAGFGVVEFGTKPDGPGQGARTDLVSIGERLRAGETITTVAEAYPADFIRYASGIRSYQALFQPQRDFKTRIWWYYGSTGTGKSHAARLQFPEAYWKNPTHNWWDGYVQKMAVIIDDYRCNFCHFSELLRLFDRYPLQLQVKGATIQFFSEDIVVTAPHRPEVMWASRTAEDLGQLMRRVEVIRLFGEEPQVPAMVEGFRPA